MLAACHEDPLLGAEVGNGSITTAQGCVRQGRSGHQNPTTGSEVPGQVISDKPDGLAARAVVASGSVACDGGGRGRAADGEASRCEWRELGKGAKSEGLLPVIVAGTPSQSQQVEGRIEEKEQQWRWLQQAESTTPVVGGSSVDTEGGTDGTVEGLQGAADPSALGIATVGGGLALWPESSIVPSAVPAELARDAVDGIEAGERRSGGEATCSMDAETLKAVARLFLSKLQVSVEVSALDRIQLCSLADRVAFSVEDIMEERSRHCCTSNPHL